MVMNDYVPDCGDLIWLVFDPQAGHEQAGRRPALVLSSQSYNGKIGLLLASPVTSRVKGYPFEVMLPPGLPVQGVILADQVKSLDWRVRKAEKIGAVPEDSYREVLGKLLTLLNLD